MPQLSLVAAEAAASPLLERELGFVALLSIAALVAVLIRRAKLPYTVALVLVGLALAFFPDVLGLEIDGELILFLLVPPLVFEAALSLRWEHVRRDLAPILVLAVFGTLAGTAVVAFIVTRLLGVPPAAAVAFGALISATDPVAVVAFFRRLGVDRRLAVLVEGESLLNDGVAIVVFQLALAVGAVGGAIAPADALLRFGQVALGGLAVGLVLGYVVSVIVLANVDDHLVETATTLALAFGAFALAERAHWSGILAVVAAGLLVGNVGTRNTSPTTRVALDHFWELLAFIANSLVFLLIGLRIELLDFAPYFGPVAVAVGAILIARAGVVYGLTALLAAGRARRPVPMAYRHVMYWGGLRGAISLALALSLTDEALGGAGLAEELQIMTFGVVLFTLLGQGLSIEALVRRLGLSAPPRQRLAQQRLQARQLASRAAARELDRLREEGILSEGVWSALAEVAGEDVAAREEALRAHLEQWPELEQEMVLQARADLLRAERVALAGAAVRGLIGDAVHHELARHIDDRAAALEIVAANRGLGQQGESDDGEAEA